jgi:hypothetical protein
MWPVSASQCINQLRIFSSKDKKKKKSLKRKYSELPPAVLATPRRAMHYEGKVDYWKEKMLDLCSSPSKPEWEEFCDGTKTTLASAQLNQYQLKILADKHQEDVHRKVMGRKVVAKFGPWTDYDAHKKIAKIERDIQEASMKEQKKARDKAWRAERGEMQKQGVAARKQEAARKRMIRELAAATQPIPDEMRIPIPDPQKAWLAGQEELKQLEEAERQAAQIAEEEVQFVIDLEGSKEGLPQELDYIPFDFDSDDELKWKHIDSSDDSLSNGLGSSDEGSDLYESDNNSVCFGRR